MLFEELERFSKRLIPTEEVAVDFPVDVMEDEESIKVVADLPGFKKENIEIYVEDGYLVIKARRKEEVEEKGKGYIRQERKYGEVQRRIVLPAEINVEGVKASYNNGVLEVILPKTEKTKRKMIKIE